MLNSEMTKGIKENTNENSKNQGGQGHSPTHSFKELAVSQHCTISITITLGSVGKAIEFTIVSL